MFQLSSSSLPVVAFAKMHCADLSSTSSLPTPPLYRAKEFHQNETRPKIHEEKRGWIGVVDGKENRISSNIGKHQKSIRGVNNTTEEK
jgi:hypothetical protein